MKVKARANAPTRVGAVSHQVDASRVAWFRRTIGRAAISLRISGVVLGYWAMAFVVGVLKQTVEPGSEGLGYVAATFGAFALPILFAFRHGSRLRSGRGNSARLLLAWFVIYLVATLARWAIMIFLQSTSATSDSLLSQFFVEVWLLFPAYFMARGVLAIRQLPDWPSDLGRSTALDATPWERNDGPRHPVFLRSRPARFYLYMSYVIFVGALLVVAAGSSLPGLGDPFGLLGGFSALSMFVIVLVARPFRRARRHSLQNVDETLKTDVRPPVLYLRSFLDDGLKLDARTTNGRVWLERHSPHTFEEVICDHLWRYGPVVALGKPGDRLPPLGAARNYLKDDEWRGGVLELMRRASIIVLVLGRTENLGWELESLIASELLSRTILVVPPIAPSEVHQRWTTLRGIVSAMRIPTLPSEIDPKHTLALLFPGSGAPRLLHSDRRDDWAYETVIDIAVLEVGHAVVQFVPPKAHPRARPSPSPSRHRVGMDGGRSEP